MSIVAATILCERKASSQLVAIPEILKIKEINGLYVNIETEGRVSFGELEDYLAMSRHGLDVKIERWSREGWFGTKPEFDQDQRRLMYIVTARNMAIDYALANNYDHLLFVDADVIPDPENFHYLLKLNQPLCGGLVPGRGAHKEMNYIMPSDYGITEEGSEIKCGHGSCGYMLIHKSIFSRLRFRWGLDQQKDDLWLSEDPAFCQDARYLGLSDAFYIDKRATSKHWDDPAKPLTVDGLCTENILGQK